MSQVSMAWYLILSFFVLHGPIASVSAAQLLTKDHQQHSKRATKSRTRVVYLHDVTAMHVNGVNRTLEEARGMRGIDTLLFKLPSEGLVFELRQTCQWPTTRAHFEQQQQQEHFYSETSNHVDEEWNRTSSTGPAASTNRVTGHASETAHKQHGDPAEWQQQTCSQCELSGSVFSVDKQERSPVWASVCYGISTTVCIRSGRTFRIEPLLDDQTVSVSPSQLHTIPHLITKIKTEDRDEFICRGTFGNDDSPRRSRRGRKMAQLTVTNKSGRHVKLYYMSYYGRRTYFLTLRRAERNLIRSYVGTTWLAYDENEHPLYINGRFNFLVYDVHVRRRPTMIVTAKDSDGKSSARVPPSVPKRPATKYMELAVVADHTFMKRHDTDKDAEDYILATMNQVQRIYDDPSLDVTIKFNIKIIKLVKKDHPSLRYTANDPLRSVQSACDYVFELKKRGIKFDFGIVLTRINFGYAGNAISGFTPIFRMCVERKSCTLIRDSGLHTAFIIAHEIGHSLGLEHDGLNNDCRDDTSKGSIMAPVVYSRFDSYYWSKCTKAQLRETINYFSCIKTPPTGAVISKHQDQLPGVNFGLDRQCRVYLGKGYTGCLGHRSPNQHCRYVFCKVPGQRRYKLKKNRRMCSYWNLPPVDGTECATDKWCINGECLPSGRFTREPIDGGWSKWAAWGACSSTCGTGVQFRKRKCDNPKAEYDGKECEGLPEEWHVCESSRPCLHNMAYEDVRASVCYRSHGKGWNWLPQVKAQKQVSKLALDCDFEKDTCAWEQDKFDNFNWTRQSGRTPTQDTGPSADHTHNTTEGHYMYMEASHKGPEQPRRKGHYTSLVSSLMPVGRACVRFSYHMFGKKQLGILQVFTRNHAVGNPEKVFWTKGPGNLGDVWHQAEVEVVNETRFRLGFKATRGNLYLSDIAIDDVTVQAGPCNITSNNPCSMTCEQWNKQRYKLNQTAKDGQRCYEDRSKFDMCVRGRCEPLGCDKQRPLKPGAPVKKLDDCGVCGGENKSCLFISGVLIVSPESRKEPILTIPKQAANIVISKSSSSPGYFRMEHDRRPYKFNDPPMYFYNWFYQKIAGTTFRHNHMPERKLLKESVFGDGPTEEDIKLLLQFDSNQSLKGEEIRVSYSFNLRNTSSLMHAHIWTHSSRDDGWSACDKRCGGGLRTLKLQCINMSTGRVRPHETCSSLRVRPLAQTKRCNTRPCRQRYMWKVSSWSGCPVCGKVSARVRTVKCKLVTESDLKADVEVSSLAKDEECDNDPKPINSSNCWKACPVSVAAPTKKVVKKCRQRSRACGYYKRLGYCTYKTVQKLCCDTCRYLIVQANTEHLPKRI